MSANSERTEGSSNGSDDGQILTADVLYCIEHKWQGGESLGEFEV